MVIKKKSLNLKHTDSNNSKSSTKYFIVIGFIVVMILGVLLVKQLTKQKIGPDTTVTVDYTLYLDDGTVFDTSIQDVGVKAGLNHASYGPFTFTYGQNQVISGFEEEVTGMGAGEKKRFTLTPERAYGPVKDNLFIKGLNRNLNVTRYSIVTEADYSKIFGDKAELNKIVNRPDIPWDMKIIDISGGKVKIENLLNVGDNVNISRVQWKSSVSSVGSDYIIVRQNPKVGDKLVLNLAGGFQPAVVVYVDEINYGVDANSFLAGKTLTFDVEIKKVEKAK